MAAKHLSRDECERRIVAVNECLAEGFPFESGGRRVRTAAAEAARRLGLPWTTMNLTLPKAKDYYGIEPDLSLYRAKAAPFTVDPLPHDGEMSAEELIAHLKRRHAERKAHEDAKALYQVRVHMLGPIGLAFIGDPHVDDPGCAWGDLERDVSICRDTEGMLATDVGDDSNNWRGRLLGLYANQEVTPPQTLKLIEWLMGALPWLLRVKGNHDVWNTEKGDPADYIHRGSPGILTEHGARLQLHLPSGPSVRVHVRHDFPGTSQFNPGHGFVRETLFGFRDHVLACGHRHITGYIPIWHNDPKMLCQGLRCASYKDFDDYAKKSGFREAAWARSMGVLIDPDYAHDPVRFIRTFFSLEELAETLTWRRSKWELGKSAA